MTSAIAALPQYASLVLAIGVANTLAQIFNAECGILDLIRNVQFAIE